jgi:hypothetical protein
MLNYLYNHSLLFAGFFVTASCMLTAWVGQWIVDRTVSLETRKEHNQVMGYASATCGLVYVVLLAFIASTVWVSYDRADASANNEASIVGDLLQDSGVLSKDFEAKALVILRDYTKQVVTEEWPKMAKGEPTGPEGWGLIRKFYTELSEVTETQPVKVAIVQEMISRVNRLYDIRRERLRTAQAGSLNNAVWAVVLLGGLFTLSFCWFFGFDKRWMHTMSNALIAITLGLVILLIVVFNCPFRGKMQISSTYFERMLNHMNKRISAASIPETSPNH